MASEQGGLEVRSSWQYSSTVDDSNYHGDGLNRQHSRATSRNLRARKRKCRSPHRHVLFIVLTFFIVATYGAVVHSYYDGVIAAIETRFDINQTTSLCIMYVRDVASVMTIIFSCYFGSRSHPPRVIGLGAFLCGAGLVCCGLPQFVYQDEIAELDISSNVTDTTDEPSPQTDIYGITSNILCSEIGENSHEKLHNIDSCPENFISTSELSKTILLIVGQILCGIGIGPVLPLSVMYLDDAIDRTCTSTVVGVFVVALVVGPMAGYFAWQYCLEMPENFYMTSKAENDAGDSEWVGAWWLGFVGGGGLIILASIPLMFFPRTLLPDAHEDDIDGEEDAAYQIIVKKKDNAGEKGCCRGLCFSMNRLFKNAAFTSMVVGLTCEVAIISGFLFLSAKYMSKLFEAESNTSTVIVVTLSLPGIVFGQIIGAYIVRHWKFNAKCCARMIFFMCVISVCCTPLLILIGCRNPKIAGYSTEYPTAMGNVSTDECNANCGCDSHVFEPVCDGEGITYVSACHAGCRSLLQESMYEFVAPGLRNRTVYTACQCVQWDVVANTANPSGGYTVKGSCSSETDCQQKIYMFVGAYVALSLITSILGNPAFFVVVRCVHPYDRAMAVGIASIILRTLGFIPAPFYFDAILNKAGCWIREFSCGDKGDCLLYDVERLRYIFIGLFLCLKFLALLAYTVTNCVVRKEADEERYEKIPMAVISDSISEDLMGTDV